MAATKKKGKRELLRGVALVDAVMAFREEEGEELEGMPGEQLARVTLGDQPLSPALRRWLESDADLFELGEPQAFEEMVAAEFGDEWAKAFEDMPKLTARVVLFEGWGSDSRRFLYLGEPDELGEYTVMTVDIDDGPFLCVNGPVDVWLAQQAGYLEDEHVYGSVPPRYEAVRKAHAKRHFGGYVAWADGELTRTLEDDDEEE